MHIQILGRGRHGNAQKMCFFAIFDESKHFRLIMFINKSHINVPIPHLLNINLAL